MVFYSSLVKIMIKTTVKNLQMLPRDDGKYEFSIWNCSKYSYKKSTTYNWKLHLTVGENKKCPQVDW